ncbi:hypothetical protein AVEN_161098-1 [Araneus ventricosus]|uniref:Mariner Mos1 transposase n=1 Tax=Araneus ventricosus TaxID=182803 RepID=A0A4Y2RS48_ARAVE|nr:hypothetical protein AVEN_161098-1 [Araneus ventricosus]
MLSDGVIFLHNNTHTARKTQELLQKFKWEVWSHPSYSPDSAPNLCSKHLSGTKSSSDSDMKSAAGNWLNGQGRDIYQAGSYEEIKISPHTIFTPSVLDSPSANSADIFSLPTTYPSPVLNPTKKSSRYCVHKIAWAVEISPKSCHKNHCNEWPSRESTNTVDVKIKETIAEADDTHF